MMKGGETPGKEEGAVAASSFAVAVGPWVAGERIRTEEREGERREQREREMKMGGRRNNKFIYIF